MTNKKFVVKLSSEERKRLNTLISKGKATAKIILKSQLQNSHRIRGSVMSSPLCRYTAGVARWICIEPAIFRRFLTHLSCAVTLTSLSTTGKDQLIRRIS